MENEMKNRRVIEYFEEVSCGDKNLMFRYLMWFNHQDHTDFNDWSCSDYSVRAYINQLMLKELERLEKVETTFFNLIDDELDD